MESIRKLERGVASPVVPARRIARQHKRVPYSTVVLLTRAGSSHRMLVLSHDLGRGGIGISSDHPLLVGEQFSVSISLRDGTSLQCDATVRYRRGLRHGLVFENLPEDKANALDAVCQAGEIKSLS